MDICIIGLGSMGWNLCLNIISRGYKVRGFDKNNKLIKKLSSYHTKKFILCESIKKLFTATSSQRLVLISLPSTEIDKCICQINKYLNKNDIIADLGNSFFQDTERRYLMAKRNHSHFLGVGVSGGPNGARTGPAIMAGGSTVAWRKVKTIFQKICSKNDHFSACVFFGKAGNGHFVKMVHNSIEYAFMQTLSETCLILKECFDLNHKNQGKLLKDLCKTDIGCYLMEITAKVITAKKKNSYYIDFIDNEIEQNGTGNWSVKTSLELGVSIPTIYAAVSTRLLSKNFMSLRKKPLDNKYNNKKINIKKSIYDLILFNFLCSISQGLNIICMANKIYKSKISLNDVLISWSSGSILQGNFLNLFHKKFKENNNDNDLKIYFKKMKVNLKSIRKLISISTEIGIPIPVLSSSLSYYDTISTSHTIGQITQLQRSFFGQHTIFNHSNKKVIIPYWQQNEE